MLIIWNTCGLLYFQLIIVYSGNIENGKNLKKYPIATGHKDNIKAASKDDVSSSYNIFSNEVKNAPMLFHQNEAQYKRKATENVMTQFRTESSTGKPDEQLNDETTTHYTLKPHEEFLKFLSKLQKYDFKLTNLSQIDDQILSILQKINTGLYKLKDITSYATEQTKGEISLSNIARTGIPYDFKDGAISRIPDKELLNASKVLQRSERQSEEDAAKNLGKALKDYFRRHRHELIAWGVALLCIDILLIIICIICCKHCCRKTKKKSSSSRKISPSSKKDSSLLLKWSFPTDEYRGDLPVRNMLYHFDETRNPFNSSGERQADSKCRKEEHSKSNKLVTNFIRNVTTDDGDTSSDIEQTTYFRDRRITAAEIGSIIRKLMRRERKNFAIKANSLNASKEELSHLLQQTEQRNDTAKETMTNACIPCPGSLGKTALSDDMKIEEDTAEK